MSVTSLRIFRKRG